MSATATLLAALFVCLGGAAHDPQAQARVHKEHAAAADEYVCPYDRGDCSLFPSLGPAVLTVPPLDPPPHAEGRVPRLAPPHGTVRAPRQGAQPRAPDLHVLQVLRT
ncbi:hypothetical protein [Streptomyces sp. ISL-36]|uniref:hypothetical protein n=1 Tax=Streptomyces sp. ISL-36 TaxID=2819182 RepID=UPI002034B064|nr:hypothetical protein [Streptomyces sp. ISL-36]